MDDAKTDPDKLNRELEYDLREVEKQRLQKKHAAEAKAKAEAERKAELQQGAQKPEETTQATGAEPPVSQP